MAVICVILYFAAACFGAVVEQCTEQEQRCGDGTCVLLWQDCPAPSGCDPDLFQCPDMSCKVSGSLCDWTSFSCHPEEIRCVNRWRDRPCIPRSYVCDDMPDCDSGIDEVGCAETNETLLIDGNDVTEEAMTEEPLQSKTLVHHGPARNTTTMSSWTLESQTTTDTPTEGLPKVAIWIIVGTCTPILILIVCVITIYICCSCRAYRTPANRGRQASV